MQNVHFTQQGDHDNLLGQGHGADDDGEEEGPAIEPLLGQGVAGQGGGEAGEHQSAHSHDDGVEQPPAGGVLEQLGVVLQGGAQGEPLRGTGVDGHGVLEGAGDNPVQREDEENRQEDEDHDSDHLVTGGSAGQLAFRVIHLLTSLTVVGLRELELDGREDRDDDGQDHAHGVGVTEVLVVVRHLEDVVHNGVGGVVGAAGGQQLDQREALEGVDGGNDQDVQGGGHDLGPLDLPEHLELGGAVHLGRLDEGLVHVAQGRHIQHDGLADGGGEQDQDDTPDGGGGIAQPVIAGGAEDLIQQTVVRVEHPLPYHGDRHGAGDHGQVEHAAEEGAGHCLHLIDGGADPQGKCGNGGHRYHHDDDGIQEPFPEDGVLSHFGIVGKADKLGGGAVQAHFLEAEHHAHDHRDHHKADEKDQAGQQEQVGGNSFPPDQSLAHAGELGSFLLPGLLTGRCYGILCHEILPSFRTYLHTSPNGSGKATVPAPSQGAGTESASNDTCAA